MVQCGKIKILFSEPVDYKFTVFEIGSTLFIFQENEVTLWKWTKETPMDDETSRIGESTGLFEPQLLASFDHR